LPRLLLLVVVALGMALGGTACGGDDDGDGSGGGSAETSLQGTVWEWQGSLYNDDSEATPDDPSKYTVEFADDGTAAIQADCNSVRAEYEESEGTLSIVLGPTTLVACEEGSLSDQFTRDLGGAAIYFFDDEGLLRIDIKFDTGTMTFAPA
jgi:heat shock protein HslJ